MARIAGDLLRCRDERTGAVAVLISVAWADGMFRVRFLYALREVA